MGCGLGTRTANHIPIAIYSTAVNRTFFAYGGTIKDQKHLFTHDMGSLYIQPDRWLSRWPTQNGPQLWQTGGEMALWSSRDLGQTWTMLRQITTNSANSANSVA